MKGSGKKTREYGVHLDDFVRACLGRLMSYTETVAAACAKFGCEETTVKRAIMRVKAQWMEAHRQPMEDKRAKFEADLEQMIRDARNAGDHRAVAQLMKVAADVAGVKAPKQVEHSGTVGLRPIAALSPQEREREIELLMAKKQAALPAGKAEPVEIEEVEAMPNGVKKGSVH